MTLVCRQRAADLRFDMGWNSDGRLRAPRSIRVNAAARSTGKLFHFQCVAHAFVNVRERRTSSDVTLAAGTGEQFLQCFVVFGHDLIRRAAYVCRQKRIRR